jgi:hypothetical protein
MEERSENGEGQGQKERRKLEGIEKKGLQSILKGHDNIAQTQHIQWDIAARTKIIPAFAAITIRLTYGYAFVAKG